MATPLSTREIVLGKWRGGFQLVPKLAILPGLIALGIALRRGLGFESFAFGGLIALVVVAIGAVVTSVGLALAAWQPRLGRAIGMAVGLYLFATVIYPTVVLMLDRHSGPGEMYLLWPSPFFAMFDPLSRITWRMAFFGGVEAHLIGMTIWVVVASMFAGFLFWLTLWNFDRLLGRVPDRSKRPAREPTLALRPADAT
jgi:ABC-type transport system involved in multi-copper enzyme maturation permease subunit